MTNTAVAVEVEFHSNKNCFVLLDCNALGNEDFDELRYFEIRQCVENNYKSIFTAGRILRANGHRRADANSRLLINGIFANCLGLKAGDQVLITIIKEPKECLAVVAEPVSSDDWEVVFINAEKIEEQLLVQLRLVYVGMEFPIWIDGGYCLFLKLVSCESNGSSVALLMEDTEVTVAPKVRIKDSKNRTSNQGAINDQNAETSASLLFCGLEFFDTMLNKLHRYATVTLSKTNPIFMGYPIIVGSAGSGKTTLANALCMEMKNRKLIQHISIVECKLLKGKAVESVENRLKNQISNAIDSQPAVIVLDDLDCLCSSCTTMEQITPGMSMVYERMSRMLSNLISDSRRRKHQILFLATTASTKTINPYLVSPRGIRYFDFIVEIPELNLDARRGAIGRLVSNGFLSMDKSMGKDAKGVFTWVAKRTDGYVMADLVALVERTLIDFENETDHSNVGYPTIANFKNALDEFIPMALSAIGQGVAEVELTTSFDGIGGLEEAKTILEKVLLLPTKYPKIFSTLPIRLPRGILLYGPSGCGKTLLASAVAKDYNLKLIHIKGAELLSKYIGASEQGVRDTFIRAKSMKPCLVFFDEFDALAPRRGHDSTGVTDRVVNQLLTEMDGVEGLEGVFVLAASSRPDLIDPALLRPGRIDKRVYCGMPSEADRLDILTRQSQPLQLDSSIDLQTIATRTEGFTGADLKTILLDSHLLALREATVEMKKNESGLEKLVDGVRIMHKHLMQVLDTLKPSASLQDRRRFEKMYASFRGDLDEQAMIKFYQDKVGQRATLA